MGGLGWLNEWSLHSSLICLDQRPQGGATSKFSVLITIYLIYLNTLHSSWKTLKHYHRTNNSANIIYLTALGGATCNKSSGIREHNERVNILVNIRNYRLLEAGYSCNYMPVALQLLKRIFLLRVSSTAYGWRYGPINILNIASNWSVGRLEDSTTLTTYSNKLQQLDEARGNAVVLHA